MAPHYDDSSDSEDEAETSDVDINNCESANECDSFNPPSSKQIALSASDLHSTQDASEVTNFVGQSSSVTSESKSI